MNRNVRSVEQATKKINTKTAPGLHGTYMQRFLNTTAHKNLESALQQKLNFSFNKQRALTPSKKGLDIDFFDDDGFSPRYINPKEKVVEKKIKKKSPGSSPRVVSKSKPKETTNTLPKSVVRQTHIMHKEAAKALRESPHLVAGNKVKESVGEAPKKPKVKGPNTLLHREPIVELPTTIVQPLKKAKEPMTTIKETTKDISSKAITKKETNAKGDKKVSANPKKATAKAGAVKARRREQ